MTGPSDLQPDDREIFAEAALARLFGGWGPLARAEPMSQHPQEVMNGAFQRLLLEEYAPAGAVVTDQGDIICTAGLVGRYQPLPAEAGITNIFDIAPADARIRLPTALDAVARSGTMITEDAEVEISGIAQRMRLTVRPPRGSHKVVFLR
jgi:hypothetical protein